MIRHSGMNKPLTPGEVFDICGFQLTKAQAATAKRALQSIGYTCDIVGDRHIVAFPKGVNPVEEEPPRYAAATKQEH